MTRILLIEPDHILAETYRRALIHDKHKVVVCSGAQLAITTADKRQPDLVILELQLVEHSGIEFLYEFRSYPEWQAIPVLVQTVVPPVEFADNWQLLQKSLGVTNYLYKPQTSLRQLLAAVQSELAIAA